MQEAADYFGSHEDLQVEWVPTTVTRFGQRSRNSWLIGSSPLSEGLVYEEDCLRAAVDQGFCLGD